MRYNSNLATNVTTKKINYVAVPVHIVKKNHFVKYITRMVIFLATATFHIKHLTVSMKSDNLFKINFNVNYIEFP